MKIGLGTVVSLDYTLRIDNGELVDSSQERGPLNFAFGVGRIIPGLERQLEGLQQGDERKIVVSPDEGYGPAIPEAVQQIARGEFPANIELKEGLMLYVEDPIGKPIPFSVKTFNEEHVTVDFNHPLAGKTLTFDVKVVGVREATPQDH